MDSLYLVDVRCPADWTGHADKRIYRWGPENTFRVEVMADNEEDAVYVAMTIIPSEWSVIGVHESATW